MKSHPDRNFFRVNRQGFRSLAKQVSPFCLGILLGFLFISTSFAQSFGVDGVDDDFLQAGSLSLEELLDLRVTSVSKTQQDISTAAAAVSVVTHEQIAASGVRNIPDALRMVPGVQVGQVGAHTWGVGVRGFNHVFSNKLLVLIDGRTIYNPLFSGVQWDIHHPLMEDIDRIEVVRGPGASLWGANAVNGVINIITKTTKETQGGYVEVGGGMEERAFAAFRFGDRIGEDLHYRIYGQYKNQDDAVFSNGKDAGDGYDVGQGGFRIDWEPDPQVVWNVQGDIYGGQSSEFFEGASLTSPTGRTAINQNLEISGGNFLTRWTRYLADDHELSLLGYVDHTDRDSDFFGENRLTFDLELQHRFQLTDSQEFTWGLSYYASRDDIRSSFQRAIIPEEDTIQNFGAFLQDSIEIVPDKLKLTLGSKFESNEYTGFEYQPSIRLAWSPDSVQSVWAAVSRAVRTPSRAEADARLGQMTLPPGFFPFNPAHPTVQTFFGSDDFQSEELLAYEIGYRRAWHPKVSSELALFYNEYDHLRSLEPGMPFFETTPAPPHFILPLNNDNLTYGETYGVELSLNLQITDKWKLVPYYSYLQMQLHNRSSSRDSFSAAANEGANPHHQAGLSSYLDLPSNIQLFTGIRYVDRLPSLNIDAYVLLDAQLSWRPSEHWEIAVVARNLLDTQHPEFASEFNGVRQTEIQSSVFGKISYRF